MNSSDRRLIDKQAHEITRLNEELVKLYKQNQALNADLAKLRPAHDYYMMLQNAAKADETIMAAFQQLILLITLSQEEEIDGLTCAQ